MPRHPSFVATVYTKRPSDPSAMTSPFPIPVWDQQSVDLDKEVETLRRKLGVRGDIVSPQGRAKTLEVFGEPLTPDEVVTRICEAVRREGSPAVLHYTQSLDGVEMTSDEIRVKQTAISKAHESADADFLAAVRRVRGNINEFQRAILQNDRTINIEEGGSLTQRFRPLARIAVCVPGGAAAYPSSLLMTAVCAQAAGVEEIVVVAPPTKFGSENRDILAVCGELGLGEIYRVGGAQAVAALAYGTDEIPPVDLICGPGNLFVALAKRYVYGEVAIDSIAGPSELVLVADETMAPRLAAADLIAQAEHAPGASLMITTSGELIAEVQGELAQLLTQVDRGDEARESLLEYGALIRVADFDAAVSLTNQIAPEHLQIATKNARDVVDRFRSAGAIFLGPQTPVALGDYVAGPSHVLPTGGTARFASGLSSNTFLRSTSIIEYDSAAIAAVADTVSQLSQREGLSAHGYSVELRNQN